MKIDPKLLIPAAWESPPLGSWKARLTSIILYNPETTLLTVILNDIKGVKDLGFLRFS
jgi:hypothetical protein